MGPTAIMIGQTLGHYRIVEQIGSEGIGEVWRARAVVLTVAQFRISCLA